MIPDIIPVIFFYISMLVFNDILSIYLVLRDTTELSWFRSSSILFIFLPVLMRVDIYRYTIRTTDSSSLQNNVECIHLIYSRKRISTTLFLFPTTMRQCNIAQTSDQMSPRQEQVNTTKLENLERIWQ